MEAKYLKGALLLALASVLLIGLIPHIKGALQEPTLVSPENGENTNDNTPFMDWESVENATEYYLQIDNDIDFLTPFIDNDNLSTDNYAVENALPDGVYYWRVRAENATNNGPWSENWTFRVDTVKPLAPGLISPDNGENLSDNTPTLNWSAVPDNSRPVLYYAAVSDNSAFPYENRNSGWITADQWNVSPALPDGVWYWRVRARDNAGNVGDNSVTRSFRVVTLAPPELISPANGENLNDNTPFMDWNPTTGADNYDLQIDNDSDYSSPEVNVTDILTDNYQVTTKLVEGLYYWHVRGENAGGLGPWSDNWVFRIDITAPSAPGLISPAASENLSDNTPTLNWSAVPDNSLPVLYYAAVSDNSAFPYENRNSGWITADQWNVSPALPDGVWYWRVRVRDNAGNIGDNSGTRSFRVDTIKPSAPGLVSPANGENLDDNTPTLDWSTVSDDSLPVRYYAAVSDSSAFPYENRNSGWITADQWNVSPALPDGVWYWRVRARDDAGNIGDNSVTRSFRVVTIAPPAVGIEVLISPDENWAAPGENVTFTVTVTNTGNVLDNYDLTVSDNENWGPTLDDNVLEDLSPGENGETTLRVTIPENAENFNRDKITVTATSQENAEVSDNDSCIAHAGPFAPGVEVSISPDYDNGMPCTTLEYTVTVRNNGAVDDNYDLSWSDNAGWGDNIWLEDNSLWVAHGDENSTTLYVHVPENAEPCTEDNITVTATSQENAELSDNDSCIAHAVSIVREVKVTISPSENDGLPGDEVTFFVIVMNLGNAHDNFDLDADDNSGWTLTLDDDLFENIPPGEYEATILRVIIPGDITPCTRNSITVTATSVSDNTISDSDSCVAHAAAKAAPSVWPKIAGIIGVIAIIGTVVAFYKGGRPFSIRFPVIAGIIGGIVMIGGAYLGSPVIAGIGGALVIIGILFAFYMRGRYYY